MTISSAMDLGNNNQTSRYKHQKSSRIKTQQPKKMENQRHEFDLEKRTTEFAKQVVRYCMKLPKNSMNERFKGQLAGCSGSVGANYREANDCLGPKDFKHRLKISRKEAKETIHWLEISDIANHEFHDECAACLDEANQLKNILSSIIRKLED